MKRISVMIMILLVLGITACQKKDKPTTGGGGGDNTATISGTVDIDGTTLTIYDEGTTGKVLWGPTVIGKSYSAKFSVKDGRTGTWMVFSKSGCNDGAIGVDVRPGTNINVGGTSLLCG